MFPVTYNEHPPIGIQTIHVQLAIFQSNCLRQLHYSNLVLPNSPLFFAQNTILGPNRNIFPHPPCIIPNFLPNFLDPIFQSKIFQLAGVHCMTECHGLPKSLASVRHRWRRCATRVCHKRLRLSYYRLHPLRGPYLGILSRDDGQHFIRFLVPTPVIWAKHTTRYQRGERTSFFTVPWVVIAPLHATISPWVDTGAVPPVPLTLFSVG